MSRPSAAERAGRTLLRSESSLTHASMQEKINAALNGPGTSLDEVEVTSSQQIQEKSKTLDRSTALTRNNRKNSVSDEIANLTKGMSVRYSLPRCVYICFCLFVCLNGSAGSVWFVIPLCLELRSSMYGCEFVRGQCLQWGGNRCGLVGSFAFEPGKNEKWQWIEFLFKASDWAVKNSTHGGEQAACI